MRVLDRILFAVTLVMALWGVLLSVDLVQALNAESCSTAVSPHCYPWGAEGPAAGLWRYESKANYLLSSFAQLVLILSVVALVGWKFARQQPLANGHRLLVLCALAGVVMLALA